MHVPLKSYTYLLVMSQLCFLTPFRCPQQAACLGVAVLGPRHKALRVESCVAGRRLVPGAGVIKCGSKIPYL